MNRRKFLTGAASALFAGCVVLPQGQPVPTISIPHFVPPSWMAENGKRHFQKRIDEIEAHEPIDGGVLLIGDSITEGWMNHEFPYDGPVANHGIGWDTSAGLLARKELAFLENPDVVFVMIGTNDLGYERDPGNIIMNKVEFITEARDKWPNSEIYVQSILPRNDNYSGTISELNKLMPTFIDAAASDTSAVDVAKVAYLNLTEEFSSTPGVLNPALTYDGLHLNAEGYRVWGEALKPYLPS